jgi:hypothetical protein
VSNRLISFSNSVVGIQAGSESCELLLDFLLMNIPVVKDEEPHLTFFMDWDETSQEYSLEIPGVHEYHSKSPALIGTYLMDRLGYHLADRSQGGLLLHAACVAYQEKGILLVGGTGVGKSSLTTYLIQKGCAYLTDELSFLPFERNTCQGFARPIQLKTSSRSLFADALDDAEHSGYLLSSDYSCLLQPQGLDSNTLSQVDICPVTNHRRN